MYDLIPPYGTLDDLLPGVPRQPEPAERYNALNELLKQEPQPQPVMPFFSETGSMVKVCNASDETLTVSSIVQIDTDFINDSSYIVTPRNFYLFGKPVEKLNGIWGIALDNIPPRTVGGGADFRHRSCGSAPGGI